MTIQELIELTTNKLNYLQSRRSYFYSIGDTVEVSKFDDLIFKTEQTLDQLKTLLT